MMLPLLSDFVDKAYCLLTRNILVLLSVSIAAYLYLTYYQNGLDRYPGPFLANFGKLWHRLNVQTNRHPHTLIDYHRSHGSVVRIGPSTLSVSDPDYVAKIYGIHSGFLKSDMYDVFSPRINGKVIPSLLSARDPQVHAALHKPVAREFAMTVITEYEPLMDRTLEKWIQCLTQNFCDSPGQVCDIALWIRFYTTEAIMDMTFSESMGFLETGKDVGGFLEAMDKNMYNSGLLCPMPWTAYIVRHNPLSALWNKSNTMFPVWAGKRISARTAESSVNRSDRPRDFLDRFLDAARAEKSSEQGAALVMNWCLVNILAGGDTTAVGLAAIIYYLLKAPDKYSKLVNELRNFNSDPILSWEECQSLPYLDACVREGHRLNPSVAVGLERDAGGLHMPDGYVLPDNTRVSMNAWVVNRQPEVFGDAVDSFIPERWLQSDRESDESYRQRVNKLKRVTLNFGAGTRACTGRHIAMVETYKAVAALLRNFDIALTEPNKEWTMMNGFMSRVKDVRCKLSKA